MQLKMTKPFNMKHVQQMLLEEDKYISDIFSKLPVSMSALADNESEQDNVVQCKKKGKIFKQKDGQIKRAQTFEELHERLEALKGKKKLGYKNKLMKQGLKNRIKKKSKKEEIIMQKKLVRTEQLAAGGSAGKKEDTEAPRIPRPKPVFNSEGKMVFSKFDFSDVGAKKKPSKIDRDPKKILQQLEKKKEKLKQLEASGEKSKVEEIKEKEAWKSVLAKASGEKVKDDPELLKRSVKKQEQKKKYSSKKWEGRKEGVQKGIQERQQKRQENILKRKKDKKINKLKKASKRGRVIPGF
ncbi:surfeit locus protein 6 homolog [Cephus cinctus]|uniref:Surfeit locus protein 6 homolog n=1 Tax=Cephus cinctus TaxID=211228 RepID=A0AAJ7CAL4_CEPCN|nr:surfeit locus protein 6 homolog [Cephus cinctus]